MASAVFRALLLAWATASLSAHAAADTTTTSTSTTTWTGAQTHSLAVRPRRRARRYDGAWERRRALLKFGLDVPHDDELARLARRASPAAADDLVNQNGLIGLTGQTDDRAGQAAPSAVVARVGAVSDLDDVEYLVQVRVGDQTMNLDLDTGSSDLWVFSDLMKDIKNHTLYPTPVNSSDPNVSRLGSKVTGTEMADYSFNIHYGDTTNASGVVFADTVRIGDVTATSQAIGAATAASKSFINQGNDGLLGMGFMTADTVKPTKQKTFLDNIKTRLKQPIFTAWLQHKATGSYDFGYIDSKKYQGSLQYVAINTTRGYWEVRATAYQVGNAARVPSTFQSIIDTGSTLLLLPNETVRAFYAQVPGAELVPHEGGWVYSCSTTLPDLHLEVAANPAGSTAGSPTGSTVTLRLAGASLTRGRSTMPGSSWCYGGVQTTSSPSLSIWGDVFLKAFFVVFDASEPPLGPRVGFAPQAPAAVNAQGVAAPVGEAPGAVS